MIEQHHEMSSTPNVKPFFDPMTNTISYVVTDPRSNVCAAVDSVMDIGFALQARCLERMVKGGVGNEHCVVSVLTDIAACVAEDYLSLNRS